ncbi:hypothetical protein FB451DRAFT_1184955 [Mycena latifolia]|nr:hypothetical protein FB451DRAFT_1184955 [Mycena latifolia]
MPEDVENSNKPQDAGECRTHKSEPNTEQASSERLVTVTGLLRTLIFLRARMDTVAHQVSTLHLSTLNLPSELWLEILSHLGTSDLAAARLVSRDLRWIAQSSLFKSCTFTIGLRGPVLDLHRLRLKSAFFISPEIAPVVRVCTILGGPKNSAVAVAEICDALPSFFNLRHLAFDYVRMSSATVAAITRAAANSARLSLSLVCCMTAFPQAEGPGSLRLDELAIHNDDIPAFPHDHHWLSLVNLQTLRVLNIARAPTTASFMASFVPGIQLLGLEVLDMHLRGLDGISEEEFVFSLTSFPSLRTLNLHSPVWRNANSWVYGSVHLPSDCLPMLSSFHGPHSQSLAYCNHRPTAHLKLYGNSNHASCDMARLTSELQVIAREARGLASLELRAGCPTTELSATIAATFPELKSLRLVIPSYGLATPVPDLQGVVSSIEALVLPPRLKVLYLAFRHRIDILEWALPLSKGEKTESVIRALAQRYPSLARISLCCSLSYANELQGATVWTWTRDSAVAGGGTITARRSVLCEYIDVREPTLDTNSLAANAAADALDDEWLDAIRAHRELTAKSS